MVNNSLYILVHSPLVGPLTWSLVAEQMRQRGIDVIVPILQDSSASRKPFWTQHAASASQALALVSPNRPVTLVAHSGAGPLLPAIRQLIANPVHAYIFVDAGLPRDGASRLDMMKSEDAEWAAQFQAELERGGSFPNWTFDDLQEVIPDEALRRQMVAELRPRRLPFFTEPIPVFEKWPDAPCAYIKFSKPYEGSATQAQQAGWQTYTLEAGHFHMLVDAKTVADLIVRSVNN